jgi:hypothetical protein
MVDYDELDLSPELVTRFAEWQYRFDDRASDAPEGFPQPSWDVFESEQKLLARALHALVGGCVQWEG